MTEFKKIGLVSEWLKNLKTAVGKLAQYGFFCDQIID